jgi:ATP-dependent 26S proteasome regulatory subunit
MKDSTANGKSHSVLICATVLRILSRPPEVSPDIFSQPGKLVKVRQGSKYFVTYPKTVGTVLGKKDGDEVGLVIVSFRTENGEYKGRCRTGENPSIDNGVCDLELAEGENGSFALITLAGQTFEVSISGFEVEPGDTLKLTRETMKVMAVEKSIASGGVAFVSRIIDDTVVEVDLTGGRRTVFVGKFAGKLETNGRVVLDQSASVIIGNYGLDDDSFVVPDATGVAWDDVVGQEEAVKDLQMSIELPQRKPNHFKFLGLKPAAGFLLFGPPGCSKTMLAKAVYTSMMDTCSRKEIKRPLGGFLLISGPEILDKFVGVPEALIRHVFAKARLFFKRTGLRAVIVIDECEAILARRDSGISSDILRTIVPTFLAEMQGVKESGAIVLLLTNKPGILDGAAIRDGRIDCWIPVKRPTREATRIIFLKNMKNVPVSSRTTLEKLADVCVEKLYSPELAIYEITRSDSEVSTKFILADIVSGAMIPAIVQGAQRFALTRELLKSEPDEGIREEDVVSSVKAKYQESFASDHAEALTGFVEGFKDRVIGVQKLRQAQS